MLRIQLLGGFHITHHDQPVAGLQQPRLQLLLAYLLLHAPAPVSRRRLATLFWPDSTDKQARTNLRGLLHSLRSHLPNADHHLTLSTQQIQWTSSEDATTVDLLDFHAAVERARRESRPAGKDAALQAALSAYGGELLPGQYDDWLLEERARLHSLVADVLTELVALHQNQGDNTTALLYAEHLLRHDPIQESAHRLVMELHLRNENRAAALRVYHTCATMLREELGVDPSPATEEIYQRLLRLEEQRRAPAAIRTDTATLPLVGRAAEWQHLQQCWQQSQKGRAQLLLIQGEAGIGKTRLAEELADMVRHQGMVTLYTRAFAAEGDAAYAPLADLLRNPALGRGLTTLDDIWLTELARLLPEILVTRSGLPHPDPIRAAWQQRRFHEALVHTVRAVGEPLLLHFDDLQWCDDETIGWLRFLLRTQAHARLLVVGTVRSEEMDADHPLHALRHEFQRGGRCTTVELGPLPREAVGELAAAVAGQDLAAAAREELFAETEGSPLFVVEILRARLGGDDHAPVPLSTDDGGRDAARRDSADLPPKVHAVIQARLAQLSPGARELAEMAGVIGRRFTYPLLAQVSAVTEDELVTRLDELWRRRIVREQGDDAYDFSHDRIREAAYAGVSPMRRRHLHGKVARALEALHREGLDEVSSLVAQQYAAAGRTEDAARYFLRAGDYAAARFARPDALRYYERALALHPHMARADLYRATAGCEALYSALGYVEQQEQQLEKLDRLLVQWETHSGELGEIVHRRADLHIRRQKFEVSRGRIDASEFHGQLAVQAATAAADPTLEAEAYLAWGMAAWHVADFEQARARFEMAYTKATEGDAPGLKGQALELIAQTGMFTGANVDFLLERMRAALANYDEAGDLPGRCKILNKLGYLPMAQGTGDYAEALEHYRAGLALCRRIDDSGLEALILRNLGLLFGCMGRYTEAFAALDEAAAVSKRSSLRFHSAVNDNYLGYVCYQSGDLERAAQVQAAALRELRAQKNHQWAVKALTNLGQIHLDLADEATALEYAQEARRISVNMRERRQESYAATLMGHLLLRRGHIDQAADAYGVALERLRQLQLINRAQEPLAGLADVALHRGDLPTAQRHVAAILAHLESHRLDRTDEALCVYMICHRVLAAADDPRAQALLQRAAQQLQERAATLATDAQRAHFWAAPLHQAVLQACQSAAEPAAD